MADGFSVPQNAKLTVSFNTLITSYKKIQSQLLAQVRALGSNLCSANPGQFILIQFQMSQVAQVGESISNLIAQINSLINSTIRNQKPQ